MATRKKARGFVDPVSATISRNVEKRLGELGWTQKYLAEQVGCHPTKMSRLIDMGYNDQPDLKRWDVALLLRVTHALEMSVEALAESSTPQPTHEFRPQYHDPKILLNKFAEHEKGFCTFLTFDRLPACPRMTVEVQRRVHLSINAPWTGTDAGVALVENSDRWGDARRERYLAREQEDIPKTITIMLRSEFEWLVRREPPFDLCGLESVAACLDYLRQRCVSERGFRLLLIDEERLSQHPDLEHELRYLVAVGVLGEYFAYRKLWDQSVIWTERSEDVRRYEKMLKRLMQLATYSPEERDVLTELETYQRLIDKEISDQTGIQREKVRFEDAANALINRIIKT